MIALRSRTWMGVLSALLAAASLTRAQEAWSWPDTFVGRVEALAVMQTLNAEILSNRSSTATLEQWCRDHRLADTPTIVAKLSRGRETPATAEQRLRLQVNADEPVKYRRVQLQCGVRVLAEADNWYVAGRLTAEMNRLLETTDMPFGRVVQSLEPYRQTFAAKLLWSPLPDGWDRNGAVHLPSSNHSLVIPQALFEHRAVLYTREHLPFSEVDEIYQRDVLAFAPPRTR